MIVLYVSLLCVGLIVASHRFVQIPDHDRPLAFPDEPQAWGGVGDGSICDWRHILSSLLFWSLLAAAAGLVGSAMTALLPSAPLVNAVAAVVAGVATAAAVATRLARRGSGALTPLRFGPRKAPGDKPRVLFVCGSLNQTTQMHQIARQMPEVEAHYTPYFSDHWFWVLTRKLRMIEPTIVGYKRRGICLEYLTRQGLSVDLHGERNRYDMVLLPNDQILAPSLRDLPAVLVQEGIQDPPDLRYFLWRYLRLFHRVLAGTSTFGLSGRFERFCVASEGYRDHFIDLGVDPDKLVVTGMPNFDDCKRYCDNDFPHRDYVLVCTTDARETFALGNRKRFLRKVLSVAAGRQLIFKLHPNERRDRATREIHAIAPKALVFAEGSAEQMVANCSVLITEWSSLTFVGAALGKEVHSHHPMDKINRLLPIQNGVAAENIAEVCREVLGVAVAKPVEDAARANLSEIGNAAQSA